MVASLLIFVNLLAVSVAGALCEKAESLYFSGELKEARAVAEDAATKALEVLDTTSLIKAYCLQADIAIDCGNDIEAVDFYNKCIDYSPYGEPMFMLSSSLYNIASIYFQNGENDQALNYINKSILIDSRRASDSILALKYLLAAEILFKKEEYSKATEMVEKGLVCTQSRKNYNVQARLMLVKAKCLEAMSGDHPDWEKIEQEYRSALTTLQTMTTGYYYGTSPYSPEFLYRLGLAVDAQGKDAKEYFTKAIDIASCSKKMHGVNPFVEIDCCKALADILIREGQKDRAQQYLDRAESLSYVPYVKKMGNKLSLSQMEFIRREKEMEIERQKDRAFFLWIFISVLSSAIICLVFMYRHQIRQRRIIEEKNSQLVKLGLQKDKLISMLQTTSDAQIENTELKAIINETVPFPDIKLSKREQEVLAYCCKGMISKEIAAKMGVSVRTIESHKLNLFHKIGVNTTGELIAFAFKSGLGK